MSVTIEDAQARLLKLIEGLNPGERLEIVKDGRPLAMLTRGPLPLWPAQAGSAKSEAFWMAPDFDAPLDDFQDYME